MADVMTKKELDNINLIVELSRHLSEESQRKLYYIGVGLAYSDTCLSKKVDLEEKEDASSSIN